jgi:ATP-dependent Clp protease adapter protein ClpS
MNISLLTSNPNNVSAFTIIAPSTSTRVSSLYQNNNNQLNGFVQSAPAGVGTTGFSRSSSFELRMSSNERDTKRTTKKSVQVMDKIETKAAEDKKKEEMWRVVLHNDEVHTFNYVVRSLTKVIGTLDRKAAFEICVQTHGIGKATITKTWKKQAEQFCLGLQRQGLTVSISPDEDFEGGHSGGGL